MLNAENTKAILEQISGGAPIKPTLAEHGACWSELWEALDRDPELQAAYDAARARRADVFVEEIVTIADTDEDPQRARNRIDVRKWVASKMQPRTYGDKVDVNVHGQVDLVGVLADARTRLQSLRHQQSDALTQDAEFVELPSPARADTQSVAQPAPLPPELE